MVKICLYIVATLTVLLGCVAFLSPIPGGIIVLIIGLAMLVSISPSARQLLRMARSRSHRLNSQFHHLEHRLEKRLRFLALALIDTRPVKPEIEKSPD